MIKVRIVPNYFSKANIGIISYSGDRLVNRSERPASCGANFGYRDDSSFFLQPACACPPYFVLRKAGVTASAKAGEIHEAYEYF